MDIVDPRIESYLKGLYDQGDPVLHEMEKLADERHFPIVGPLVGRTLYVLARAIGARRVFELGSGYGYSALHFARAVGPEGIVHCTELSERNVLLAEQFLRKAGVWEQIVFHREEATAAFRKTVGPWDIVFNDIDKDGYPDTIELAYQALRPGGLFLTDNVLWHSRVLPGQTDGSAQTNGVLEFTKRLFAHRGFATTIDPARDGLAIAVRL